MGSINPVYNDLLVMVLNYEDQLKKELGRKE